jgi:hypothetical protein
MKDREAIAVLVRWCPTTMTTGQDWAERVGLVELGLVALLMKPFELDLILMGVRSLETQPDWRAARSSPGYQKPPPIASVRALSSSSAGEPPGTRTLNRLIKSQLLCQLS